jgi:hypothetical protein
MLTAAEIGARLRAVRDDARLDGVVINVGSPRPRAWWSLRSIIAHELCHVLFDRIPTAPFETMSRRACALASPCSLRSPPATNSTDCSSTPNYTKILAFHFGHVFTSSAHKAGTLKNFTTTSGGETKGEMFYESI